MSEGRNRCLVSKNNIQHGDSIAVQWPLFFLHRHIRQDSFTNGGSNWTPLSQILSKLRSPEKSSQSDVPQNLKTAKLYSGSWVV